MQPPHEFDVDGFQSGIAGLAMRPQHIPLYSRMSCWLDEIDASMDPVINQLQSIHAIFLLQVGIVASLDIVNYRLPAVYTVSLSQDPHKDTTNLSSLLTKSPKPGVSTTVSLKRTPFSSISREAFRQLKDVMEW